ncbi:GNAT family N-acetyltransferase [Streptomyces kebangsaanensis]|uniref:GNAT family N-acetyltransferase n=1 Tax=Streptomyces kebangsaanensis TaxID=864058 RepID=UPI00093B3292|nr:GNAT family N-acetyltransferase [Streptomyces kebangsaanensis]
MFFRWDWLRPVLTAPVVPTLGPVHPQAFTVDLFEAARTAAHSDRHFLPYDKDRRWSCEKEEAVLPDDIVHRPDHTLIPTLSRRGRGTVKVYAYGHRPDTVARAGDVAAELAAMHGAAVARMIRPFGPETRPVRGTRIQLQDFSLRPCPAPEGPVRPLEAWPAAVQETFGAFAATVATDGFAFLWERMQAGHCGPVLTTALGSRIVGAIGPMEIRPDPLGVPQLMPQYFAVLPEARGHGLGRVLWRAAMHWGQTHGAAYQLLQTEIGGASDRLCQSEGLTSLGFTRTDHV